LRKEWSIISNVYELYKRIMKHDIKAVDQIQSLEDAKYIIKMMLKTNVDIYNGQGIMSQMFMKKRQIIALRECSFCMIEEFDGKMECTKNRYGNRTMEDCEGYNFEEVKLSDISVSESTFELQKKYYGKNILLLLNK
jgi:hypothetical protein